MKTRRFSEVLNDAIAGDTDSVEAILSRFSPLIRQYSKVANRFDEDMCQHIILHIIKKIHKFDPNYMK